MQGVLFGGVLVASFLGGLVALLAPCCVSVMLPAYLATGLRRRAGVLVATLVFAAGVATVIVPIGVGATALSALVAGHHFVVFAAGGVAMAAGGVAVLSGWKPRLPMPASRAGGRRDGVVPIYLLGVFSGAASSCCAPVLAGLAVLSGASGSFPVAIAVSLTYVAGMVAPLALIAVLWDRRDWSASRLLSGRTLSVAVFGRGRRLTLGTLASGLLLIAMGALTVVVAFTGPGMGSGGWQVQTSAALQHWAAVATRALAWLPGWVFALVLLSAAGLVAGQVRRHHRHPATPAAEATPPPTRESAPAVAMAGPPPDRAADPVLESAPGSDR